MKRSETASNNSLELMNPHPPDGTAKVQQLGNTDSFECLGFGTDAPNYIFLAVVWRPIGSDWKPRCKDGQWYWYTPCAAYAGGQP